MTGVVALLFTAVPNARVNTTAPINTTTIASSLMDTTDDDDIVAPPLNTTVAPLGMGTNPTILASLNSTTTETPPTIDVVDHERLSVTFWVYLTVRVCYG